jgi:UDP-N-acetylmuramoylalanine--D-glutamate ligase
MENKTAAFKTWIKNKRVAVLGVGISNRPLIRFIHALGANITAFDILEIEDPVLSKTRNDFLQEGISLSWSVGKDYLKQLKGFDVIFRTPKMRPDVAQLRAERERGAVITSEMEVFMELCPARMFGITGSDGKTTTTTLISLILQAAGYTVHVGGNIGMPLLDRIDRIRPEDMVVLELSSFQLMSMRKSPDVAVITNISPNHLDVHKDYQEYIDAKRNIFLYQPFDGRLVLNAGNYETRSMSPEARGEVAYFSRSASDFEKGATIEDGWLIYRDQERTLDYLKEQDILIPGQHNVENYLAAIVATKPYVTPEAVCQVATTFHGVEHRLELVRELNGVRYFNSSIDTSPTRTKAAMKALADRGEKVVLIAGGKDKKCDYTMLGESILKVSRKIILCGDNAALIEESIVKAMPYVNVKSEDVLIVHVDTYEDAVQRAHDMAVPGEIVVLSPAGTSYDKFRHFEERGNLFKQLVMALA